MQAALVEGGFEAWTQGFVDFAAMAPGGAVDLSPVRRDMELFFAVVQFRGGEFHVKQSLRLQSTTGSFGACVAAPICVGHAVCINTIDLHSESISDNVTTALNDPAGGQFGGTRSIPAEKVAGKAQRHSDPSFTAHSGAAAPCHHGCRPPGDWVRQRRLEDCQRPCPPL